MKELRQILKKEFTHIFRDRITLFLVLAIPIMLVLLFGFTISTDIHHATISVLDLSSDSQSKALVEKITASGYFEVVSYPKSEQEIDNDFKDKNIKLAIIIPNEFEDQLTNEKFVTIQIISDVSDMNVASILNNYVKAILNDFTNDFNGTATMPIELCTQMLYNPEANSVYMFVPGIITLIMIIVTALMSSITLAREVETGTMRMLLIAPVNKAWVVVGKVIPYMILSFISTITIIVISVLVFKMPIKGSVWLLLAVCIIFMLTSASFGTAISSLVKTQIDAMMITMMGLFLPTALLSGFLFPIDNMPYFFQILANIFPGKWFIIAIKDVMLKGSGFLDIWLYMLILFIMAAVLMTLSLIRLDKRR